MENLTELFNSQTSIYILFGAAFLGGLISSISPCSLSMLPLIIGYVGGYSKENPPQQGARHRGTATDSRHGMALHHHLGVSAQAPLPPANPRIPRPNPLPHLPRRPHRPPLPYARFRGYPYGSRACTRRITSPLDVSLSRHM